MQSDDADDTIDELFNRPETEKTILEVAYLCKLKCAKDRLPTLSDIEVVYPRLKEKIVYSRVLREEAMRHVKRQQVSPGNEEVVEWIKHFFNLTDVETS
jgi:hypothetical protein